MNTRLLDEAIQVDMAVRTLDGAHLGSVTDVWPDADSGQSGDTAASAQQSDAESTDPELYTFSEGMPGEGDAYFRVRMPDGRDLYVPFSAVAQAESEVVELAIDEATIPGMQWDVIPDFLNITTETDSQGGPHVA